MKRKTEKAFKRLEKQRLNLLSIYRSLSDEQLRFNPGPESWNLLQVMRHLVTAEKLSLIYIQRKISRPEKTPKAGVGSRFRSLLLKLALFLPIKFKAPKIAEVEEAYPDFNEMVLEWDEVRNEYQEIISINDAEILSKALYRHPRAGLLNIKQAIEFMEDHVAHHKKQVERIMNHHSFPADLTGEEI